MNFEKLEYTVIAELCDPITTHEIFWLYIRELVMPTGLTQMAMKEMLKQYHMNLKISAFSI